MTQAIPTHTTPPTNPQLAGPRTPYAERVSPEARAALAEVAAGAPSILDLTAQLAAADAAYRLCDDPKADELRSLSNNEAMSLLFERREALRAVIATLPPVTIQDAACIVQNMTELAGMICESNHEKYDFEIACSQLERMALGVLPIVAKAAGLDMSAMGWADNLRLARYLGAGVLS